MANTVSRMRSLLRIEMYKKGGYRERYALLKGNKSTVYINGHKCYKFTYSKFNPYQDANGATYDTVKKCWID